MFRSLAAALFAALCAYAFAAPPTPREYLGFTPGDERKLANYEEISGYFQKLAKSSVQLNGATYPLKIDNSAAVNAMAKRGQRVAGRALSYMLHPAAIGADGHGCSFRFREVLGRGRQRSTRGGRWCVRGSA